MSTETPLVYGQLSIEKEGRPLKIKLQQITPELIEPVIDHMTKYFLRREPITAHCSLLSDPESVRDFHNLWANLLKQGAGIVALVENHPNAPPHNIIGANVTGISETGKENDMKFHGTKFLQAMETVYAITEEGNIYEKYVTKKYLTAVGLSVHPDYHGIGLGLKLLEARKEICKAFGLKMTATVFTAGASQHIAKRAGFHVIIEREYSTYEVNGRVTFPDLDGKMSLMAKVFD